MKSKIAALFALTLCIASAFAGPGIEPRKVALLSLIGDFMTVVTYRPGIGSHLDKNARETFAIPDATFDHTALLAASDAIKKADASASVVLIAAPSTGMRTEQRHLLKDQRFVPTDELSAALTKEGATHLLLMTKYRAAARLQAKNDMIGSGTLEGLGFYVDRQTRLIRSDTGEIGRGFLAPYAFFKISLIELSSSTVLKEQAVTASTALSSARDKDGDDPWDALSPGQKVAILRALIRNATEKAIPTIFQP